MQNLISNALKFSRPNVPPHIIIKVVIKVTKKPQNLPEKLIVTFQLQTMVLALKKNTTIKYLKYFKDFMERKIQEQELVLYCKKIVKIIMEKSRLKVN
jgi:hypothetical protein